MKKFLSLLLSMFLLTTFVACGEKKEEAKTTVEAPKGKTLLEFMGQASTEIISKDGVVLYIDPYMGNYNEKADIILITHEHEDHNEISLITQNEGCKTFRVDDVLKNGEYKTFEEKGFKITAVPAYNSNHGKASSVGFVIEVDGKKIYHAGDTSKIDEMKNLSSMNLDYALLPYDGEFNMGIKEMEECAKIINAKNIIPIHGRKQKVSDINLDNLKPLKIDERIELN
ncbi:MAG: MBL fold metallo-hydrolase [Clostridium sp.]